MPIGAESLSQATVSEPWNTKPAQALGQHAAVLPLHDTPLPHRPSDALQVKPI